MISQTYRCGFNVVLGDKLLPQPVSFKPSQVLEKTHLGMLRSWQDLAIEIRGNDV
jgi:hypothetical protein